jgi:protein-tyrosine-phosphatase
VLDDARPDACPIFPGKRHLDWDLPNPDRKSWNEVWAIRDEIDSRVQQVLEELVGTRG